MKAYFAKKFKEDYSDKVFIENVSGILFKMNIETVVIVRDYEKWGRVKLSSNELMAKTFLEIDLADILIMELSEKGVGLGIEAGYAYARQKPIFVIAKEGSDISSTIMGIAKEVVFYKKPEDITDKLVIPL